MTRRLKKERTQTPIKYTPRWFTVKSNPLVFANYGGKAGTILDLKLDFSPNMALKKSLDEFYSDVRMISERPAVPITIEEGDNHCIGLSSDIRTINWKEKSLAEVLDPTSKVNDLISRALDNSKEEFKAFCDSLENSEELGELACTITLTKGRFRTNVTDRIIFQNVKIANRYDRTISSLRECLSRWDELEPRKADLFGKLARDYEEIRKEMQDNLQTLENSIDDSNISKARLRVERWNTLQSVRDLDEKKIRWFLITSETGLEEELRELYKAISGFNDSIDELMRLGEFRTKRHFRGINCRREELHSKAQKTWERLSVRNRLLQP